MKVTKLDERTIQDIGHAFGYYEYGPAKRSACAPCCCLQRACSAP